MNGQDFRTDLLIDHTPEESFVAVTNIPGWWSVDIEADTEHLGHEFIYPDKELRTQMRTIVLIPGEKLFVMSRIADSVKFRGGMNGTAQN